MQQSLVLKTDIEKLKEYIPTLEDIIKLNDIDELQIAIMVAINTTLDEDSEATSETYVLEDIYDRISARYKELHAK